jgi:hypothetical protein
MNDRFHPAPRAAVAAVPAAAAAVPAALPVGTQMGGFEIREVLARGANAVVYLATDHSLAMPVAIQEYLPSRLVQRDAALQLSAVDVWHEDVVARGLKAFIDDARLLAPLDHPSLLRVTQLFEALGSAYRVMPLYTGQRLSDLRHRMVGAPDEASLRALIDGLLGALETVHRTGQVHGGVSPENILLLDDDHPVLLGPGTATRAIGHDLVDSLMATLDTSAAAPHAAGGGADNPAGAALTGVARDLCDLAQAMRFCITAEAPVASDGLRRREPLVNAIAREYPPDKRPRYGTALTDTLDAALSTDPLRRPANTAQFREWLAHGVPGLAPVHEFTTPAASARAAAVASPLAGRPAGAVAAGAAAAAAALGSGVDAAGPGARAADRAGAPAAGFASTAPAALSPTGIDFDDDAAAEPFPAAPIDRIEPWSPLPEALAPRDEPFGDPMSIERASRIVTAPVRLREPEPAGQRPRRLSTPRRSYYKALLAGGLAVLALGIVVVAAGGWNPMPALAFDAPVVERLAATAPVPPDIAARGTPAQSAPLRASQSLTLTPPAAAPAPLPEPPTTRRAPEPSHADSAATAPADATDPAAAIVAEPPSAGPAPAAIAAGETSGATATANANGNGNANANDLPATPVALRATAAAAAARAAAPPMQMLSAGSPRTACAGRTEFALYRCMQLLCKGAQWSAHAQCVRLRATDEID